MSQAGGQSKRQVRGQSGDMIRGQVRGQAWYQSGGQVMVQSGDQASLEARSGIRPRVSLGPCKGPVPGQSGARTGPVWGKIRCQARDQPGGQVRASMEIITGPVWTTHQASGQTGR